MSWPTLIVRPHRSHAPLYRAGKHPARAVEALPINVGGAHATFCHAEDKSALSALLSRLTSTPPPFPHSYCSPRAPKDAPVVVVAVVVGKRIPQRGLLCQLSRAYFKVELHCATTVLVLF